MLNKHNLYSNFWWNLGDYFNRPNQRKNAN